MDHRDVKVNQIEILEYTHNKYMKNQGGSKKIFTFYATKGGD